jgi:hypothetical protein
LVEEMKRIKYNKEYKTTLHNIHLLKELELLSSSGASINQVSRLSTAHKLRHGLTYPQTIFRVAAKLYKFILCCHFLLFAMLLC